MRNGLIDAIENFVVDKNSETENIMEKNCGRRSTF